MFRQTTCATPIKEQKPTDQRNFIQRCSDTYNQHLIREISLSQPYCYITKEPYSNLLPSEYTKSKYGAYPTWGPDEPG